MTLPVQHVSFASGEVSPSLWGRTDLGKLANGAFTMRNFFANYRGGASSRAGLKYVGKCLQPFGTPPRDINFQFNTTQGYALEFGDNIVTRAVTGTANSGGLVRLTLTTTRGLLTGNTMVVSGVVGTTEANGTWTITVIDTTHVDLQTSTYASGYVSGGATVTSAGYMRIKYQGAYVVEASKAITGATKANPCVLHIVGHGYAIGDWIYMSSMGGMTNFNGLVWIVNTVPDADHVTVTDLFGNVVDSTFFSAYTSGGTAQRIYTVVSPYAAVDLPYLKFTQNKDTMSLTCVNQETSKDYPPYDLVRSGSTSWAFTATSFAATQVAPTGVSLTAHNSTTVSTYYGYTVTAVSASGEESVAATPQAIENNDIAVNAGSNAITWTGAADAVSYNVYASTPQFGATIPSGVLYGYLGTSPGLAFTDTNIIADFTKVPPVHNNPFPSTGNYPGVVAYYQQRRFYANTLNNPDTYWASQPGNYKNFDYGIPTSDGDSFSGKPWAQQINGIQFMQPMTNGLIILTGQGAWVLNGGNLAAITPSDQTATSQAYNGCHSHVGPLVINYDILYVQAKGSIVRDLSYNFFVNIFTGTDLTILSNHLFNYHQIQQWAYCEEPFKLVWAVRDDGVLLSLTYLKEQDVYAWTRHDTNGFFVGVCSVTEPPVDAPYFIVQRYVNNQWVYYAERMDNRNWQNAEDCFCVDAGLSYPMPFPAATLQAASATGAQNISDTDLIFGGSGYTAPTLTAVDPTGMGSGATFSVTLTGGVITAVTVLTQGSGYADGTYLQISDTTGSGAVIHPIITNIVTFTASAAVFSAGNVGNVIRYGNSNASVADNGVTLSGGGKAVITSYTSTTVVQANIVEPIVNTVPNDPNNMPVPAVTGQWSVSVPTTTVSGLNHLEGLTVSILADGSVVDSQVVTSGAITLAAPASAIVVGLPYTCQLQTPYLDIPGGPAIGGRRKTIYSCTLALELSRGVSCGTNQPDASAQPNYANVPWTDMTEIKERTNATNAGTALNLFTGKVFQEVISDWSAKAQVAIQTSYPLPVNVLSVISNVVLGDSPDRE